MYNCFSLANLFNSAKSTFINASILALVKRLNCISQQSCTLRAFGFIIQRKNIIRLMQSLKFRGIYFHGINLCGYSKMINSFRDGTCRRAPGIVRFGGSNLHAFKTKSPSFDGFSVFEPNQDNFKRVSIYSLMNYKTLTDVS